MITINDYATKNHLNEWEIKDLPESDNYRLNLPNGDLTLLFYVFSSIFDTQFLNKTANKQKKLFIPQLSQDTNLFYQIRLLARHFGGFIDIYILNNNALLDTEYIEEQQYECNKEIKSIPIINIIPDWSKYIAKDNAVLFLSETDARKYKNIQKNVYVLSNNGIICNLLDKEGIIPSQNQSVILHHFNKVSIILPSIHSKNIDELSNIAKELKEKYGAKYVDVIPTHCYLSIFYDKTPHIPIYGLQYHLPNYEYEDDVESISYIDKIITTDSTGILKIQDTKHLQVIDCKVFFDNFLNN